MTLDPRSGAQVSTGLGVLFLVDANSSEKPSLSVYENVRCLECGGVYTKPAQGGTAKANPGCPDCGYVGWVALNVPYVPGTVQGHSVADHSLRRSARSH